MPVHNSDPDNDILILILWADISNAYSYILRLLIRVKQICQNNLHVAIILSISIERPMFPVINYGF